MFVEYYCSNTSKPNDILSIYQIYRVLADHTYLVNHPPIKSGKVVLVYTDQGHGRLQCAEGEYLLEPGTALLFSADNPFYYKTVENQWNFWWFEFEGNTPCQKGLLYFLRENDLISTICEKALETLPHHNSNAASYLSCLLALASDSVQTNSFPDRKILIQAQNIIKEKLYRTNVTAMAGELNVDPRTLYNVFQRCCGCSPKTYLRNHVMNTAKYLLENTTKSIGEIAEETGFSNQFHFSRVFKETYHISPGKYRKQL